MGDLVSLGAIISKGAKGSSFKFLKLSLVAVLLRIKSEKKGLGFLNGSFMSSHNGGGGEAFINIIVGEN